MNQFSVRLPQKDSERLRDLHKRLAPQIMADKRSDRATLNDTFRRVVDAGLAALELSAPAGEDSGSDAVPEKVTDQT